MYRRRGFLQYCLPGYFLLSQISPMKKPTIIAIAVVAGLLASGAIFLLTWDIPPPSAPVEKVLPDDRFPR